MAYRPTDPPPEPALHPSERPRLWIGESTGSRSLVFRPPSMYGPMPPCEFVIFGKSKGSARPALQTTDRDGGLHPRNHRGDRLDRGPNRRVGGLRTLDLLVVGSFGFFVTTVWVAFPFEVAALVSMALVHGMAMGHWLRGCLEKKR